MRTRAGTVPTRPPSAGFTLALAQMRVEGARPERNLARAGRMVAAAARRRADVVLFPEAIDVGWTHPQARLLAEPIARGRACSALCDAAQAHGVYVCAGLTERCGTNVYNAAVLISPEGEVVLHHRKLNELEIGHSTYDAGDRLGVVRTPLATFGIMICADGAAPGEVVTRTLGLMGADVVLSPSAWAVEAGHNERQRPYGGMWRRHYGAAARDFRLWIAGCSNVGTIEGGPWEGHMCIGRSLVVGPSGKPALVGPYGRNAEALLTVRVTPEPRPARGTQWASLASLRAQA